MKRYKHCCWLTVFIIGTIGGMLGVPASGQICTGNDAIGFDGSSEQVEGEINCVGLFACYEPNVGGVEYRTIPEDCDPGLGETCTVRAVVPLEFPGNSHNTTAAGYVDSPVRLLWTDSGGGFAGACGFLGARIQEEKGEAWIQRSFSCNGSGEGIFDLEISVCSGATGCSTPEEITQVDLSDPTLQDYYRCEEPPEDDCDSCPSCTSFGGGGPGGAGPGGGGGGCGGGAPGGGGGGTTGGSCTGPGAFLFHKAGGVGHPDQPGSDSWAVGRYWSHSYAERLIDDPEPPLTAASRVFLVTRRAVFRTFVDRDGDGRYDWVRPTSEYRTLERRAGSGWTLRDQQGVEQTFDGAGRWQSTADRFGNTVQGTYIAGRLAAVSHPDGRREDFVYDGGGRLAAITLVGVDGTSTRTWSYAWAGANLSRVDRPDGTAVEFIYGDPAYPDFVTRTELIGTDDASRRVTAAWQYDSAGNVIRLWRGSEAFGDGVDRWSFAYDNPAKPEVTTITDPLGQTTKRYWHPDREHPNRRPRLIRTEGICDTCGLGPDTQLEYGDPNHPFRPTLKTDATGTRTRFFYEGNGRMTTRIEAAETPLERETRWTYHPTYPALIRSIEQPSVAGGPLVKRTEWLYDGRGAVTRKIEEGYEDGSPYRLETVITVTPEGLVGAIDPPELGTADAIILSYDPARGNLVSTGRTEPLIGSSVRSHDAFNRLTSLTDANGVVTKASYDPLDRQTSVTRKGATAAEDLVTEYRYSVFGEAEELVLPKGNRVRLGRDGAGRLTTVERLASGATEAFERQRYTLDNLGNRVLEIRESRDPRSGSWVEQGRIGRSFLDRCHLREVAQGSGGAVSTTRYDYNCDGLLGKFWDANHSAPPLAEPVVEFGYDELDRLIRVDFPLDGDPSNIISEQYVYDVNDQLVEVINAEGSRTTYAFSDRGLITREQSESAGTASYRYDPRGRMVEKTDARGVSAALEYDLLDRPTRIDYESHEHNTSYTWDDPAVPFSKGRLTGLVRDDVALAYRYDRFGRMAQDGELLFEYDRNGNRTRLTYPSGVVASFAFDAADRESALAVQLPGGTTQAIVTDAAYLAEGPLTRRSLGNGVVESHLFDSRYYPQSITVAGGQLLLDWSYSVDLNGNPTAITDNLDAIYSRSFTYQDVQYFLTRADGPWGELDWTYDAVGNRLREIRDSALTTYSYSPNAAGHAAVALTGTVGVGGTSTRYSRNTGGGLTHAAGERSHSRYRYDLNQRLAEAIWDRGDEIPIATSFTYDGRGFLKRAERLRLEPEPVVSITSEATYSQGGTLYEVARSRFATAATARDANLSQSVESLVYFADTPVALIRQLSPLTQPDDVTVVYLATDHLGAPVLGTDGAGAVVWRSDREPFGLESTPVVDAGIVPGLPGQWQDPAWTFDPENPLVYNLYRWYLPQVGLYSQPDPLGTQGSKRAAEFTYAEQSPLAYVDPLGLKTCFFFSLDHLTSAGKRSLVLVDHAALYFDGSCNKDSCDPVPESLYDPTGGWLGSELGSSRLVDFENIEKSFDDYQIYQCTGEQSQTEMVCFNTSCCEEQTIQDNALTIGGSNVLACSANVSSSVSGVGPFEGIEPKVWPAALRRQIHELFLTYSVPGRYQRRPCPKK